MPATKVSRSEFYKLAFVDPEITCQQEIADKTGLKITSVSSKISNIRSGLIANGYDEDQLRKLPKSPKKSSVEIMGELGVEPANIVEAVESVAVTPVEPAELAPVEVVESTPEPAVTVATEPIEVTPAADAEAELPF